MDHCMYIVTKIIYSYRMDPLHFSTSTFDHPVDMSILSGAVCTKFCLFSAILLALNCSILALSSVSEGRSQSYAQIIKERQQ